jgi:hypothetical protein
LGGIKAEGCARDRDAGDGGPERQAAETGGQ